MFEYLYYTSLISLFACNSCLFFIYISRSHEVSCRIVCLDFRWNVEGLLPLEGFGESEEAN